MRALITVGAIHKPPAGDAASTCVTRGELYCIQIYMFATIHICLSKSYLLLFSVHLSGALSYLDETYPGAYHKDEGIAYVSVGGDAVVGKQPQQKQSAIEGNEPKEGSKEVNDVYKTRGEGSASSVAYTSYSAVSGDGEMTGDGVVPLDWTLLEGSRTIVLDGVVHSINEAGTTLPSETWYGSETVVDRWLNEALEEAGIEIDSSSKGNPFMQMIESILPNV